MKILLVTNTVNGGAGKACHRLYSALRQRGEDARLLYLDGPRLPDPNVLPFYPRVRDLFLRQVVSFPWAMTRSTLLGDPQRRYRLPYSMHRVERHPLVEWAEIVNLHWVPDFVDYSRFFARVDKPVVWTMHDMLPFAGGYHYETELGERERKVEQRIVRIKCEAVASANLAIVAPSAWLCGVSQAHPTFSGRPHRHIFNGLPLDVFKPLDQGFAREALGLPADKRIVLFSADNAASKRKAMGHLLAALGMLHRDDVALVSVGRGRLDVHGDLEYRHLGMFADEHSLALLYSSADVVVVPSIEDNSPNIIIESFACGRPVVGFAIGGIPELIASPEYGVVVSKLDSKPLAAAVDEVLTSPRDARTIRAYAEDAFGLDAVARNYAALFSERMRV